MQVIRSIAEIAEVDDPELRHLIQDSADPLLSQFEPGEYSFEALGFYIVVMQQDTVGDIDGQLGPSILSTQPELVIDHPNYVEVVIVLSDDGYGATAFISKQCADPRLMAFCKSHNTPGNSI